MRAARLLGYVDERLAARDIRRQYTEEREYDAILSALRRAMSQDEINRLTAEGSAWREEHAFDEALLA